MHRAEKKSNQENERRVESERDIRNISEIMWRCGYNPKKKLFDSEARFSADKFGERILLSSSIIKFSQSLVNSQQKLTKVK